MLKTGSNRLLKKVLLSSVFLHGASYSILIQCCYNVSPALSYVKIKLPVQDINNVKIALTFIKRYFVKSFVINKFCSLSQGVTAARASNLLPALILSWLIGPLSSLPRPLVRWRRRERYCWGSPQSSDSVRRETETERGDDRRTRLTVLFR